MPHKVGPVVTERFPESESCVGKATPSLVGEFWSRGGCWGLAGPHGEGMAVSRGLACVGVSSGRRDYCSSHQRRYFPRSH